MRSVRSSAVVTVLAMLAMLAGVLAVAPPASAEPYLRPSVATVAGALHCTGDLRRGSAPVLLLHGTTSNVKANWSWTWDVALDNAHRAHCDLQSPDSANGDIQLNGEYVVRAIRIMYQRAGRKISILGHSQGGMVARWAFKFWPDTRTKVSDYVGLSSSNHGTSIFGLCNALVGCTPANWQQLSASHFLAALNRGRETYPGISYTEISTHYDELVVPSTSPYLTPGANVTNVAVQDLCPTETVDHFGMAYDNAAWLIATDALNHAGPAKLSRISRATCGQPFMPAVDPVAFPANAAMAMLQTARSSATSPTVKAEPALRPYAR